MSTAPLEPGRIPALLYKYLPCKPQYCKDLLVRHQLYFSSHAQLNDKNELRPIIIPFNEAEKIAFWARSPYRKTMPKSEQRRLRPVVMRRVATRPFMEELFDKVVDTWGIVSLAEDPLSGSMWAHYASNGSGLCVGFRAASLHTSRDLYGSPFLLSRVNYTAKPVRIRASDIHDPRSSGDHLGDMFCVKGLEWSGEREWRVFGEWHGGMRIDHRIIEQVICGDRMQPKAQTLVRSIVKKHLPYAAVLVVARGRSIGDVSLKALP